MEHSIILLFHTSDELVYFSLYFNTALKLLLTLQYRSTIKPKMAYQIRSTPVHDYGVLEVLLRFTRAVSDEPMIRLRLFVADFCVAITL